MGIDGFLSKVHRTKTITIVQSLLTVPLHGPKLAAGRQKEWAPVGTGVVGPFVSLPYTEACPRTIGIQSGNAETRRSWVAHVSRLILFSRWASSTTSAVASTMKQPVVRCRGAVYNQPGGAIHSARSVFGERIVQRHIEHELSRMLEATAECDELVGIEHARE